MAHTRRTVMRKRACRQAMAANAHVRSKHRAPLRVFGRGCHHYCPRKLSLRGRRLSRIHSPLGISFALASATSTEPRLIQQFMLRIHPQFGFTPGTHSAAGKLARTARLQHSQRSAFSDVGHLCSAQIWLGRTKKTPDPQTVSTVLTRQATVGDLNYHQYTKSFSGFRCECRLQLSSVLSPAIRMHAN